MCFCLVTSVGQRKILSPREESNLRSSDLRSDALPLSHKDSSVSEVYYEVLMKRVLHTARISNVDSVMFLLILTVCRTIVMRVEMKVFRGVVLLLIPQGV